MVKDKINILQTGLKITNRKMAEYAGIAASGINRLRTGERSLKRKSTTISRYLDGLISFLKETGRMDELFEVTGLSPDHFIAPKSLDGDTDPDRILKARLIDWIFEDEEKERDQEIAKMSFGNRLDAIMGLIHMSNMSMSRRIHVDPSIISRFRRGYALSKRQMVLIDDICFTLLDGLRETDTYEALPHIMKPPIEPGMDENSKFIQLKEWLLSHKVDEEKSIGRLLQKISSFTGSASAAFPSFDEVVTESVLKDESTCYTGRKGLQKAVIRFLGSAIKSEAKELLLYSDEDIGWMVEDPEFRVKWSFLMSVCVNRGIHIKIIHNIDRGTAEMIDGITLWLPIYMSGMVEPYYHRKKTGSRFTHSFYLCPGVACLSGVHVAGQEMHGIYRYDSDQELLRTHHRMYQSFLLNCNELLYMQLGKYSGEGREFIYPDDVFSNIAIAISHSATIIVKEDEPQATMVLLHPLMRNVFKVFLEKYGYHADE